MRFWTVVLLSSLALAGCSKPREEASYTGQDAAAEASAPGPNAKPPPPPASPAVSVAMLAYSYAYQLVMPAKAIPDLLAQHQKACADAGPEACQIVGSSMSHGDGDSIVAKLTLQARPDWLTGFRSGLAGAAKAAGGRIANSTVDSEDLTRRIVDTEAAVRAKSALRDRLQAVLATRPGKLSDLLDVEKELARVQGEIDATQSELAVMRTRVATSLLTITYGPAPHVPALTDALRGSASALVTTLSLMITVLAAVAPWAAVGGVAFLIVRRFMPKKPKPPAEA